MTNHMSYCDSPEGHIGVCKSVEDRKPSAPMSAVGDALGRPRQITTHLRSVLNDLDAAIVLCEDAGAKEDARVLADAFQEIEAISDGWRTSIEKAAHIAEVRSRLREEALAGPHGFDSCQGQGCPIHGVM